MCTISFCLEKLFDQVGCIKTWFSLSLNENFFFSIVIVDWCRVVAWNFPQNSAHIPVLLYVHSSVIKVCINSILNMFIFLNNKEKTTSDSVQRDKTSPLISFRWWQRVSEQIEDGVSMKWKFLGRIENIIRNRTEMSFCACIRRPSPYNRKTMQC